MVDDDRREAAVQNAAARRMEADPAEQMARLYREHAALVLRTAQRVTGSTQDAEDVLQTVFLRLVRRGGRSGLSDSPTRYLCRAAINAALDVVRSRRAAGATPLDSVEPSLTDDSSPGPERAQGSREIREIVRRTLGELSPRSAEIVVLRYFEGYDNHEIAEVVGTSRSTVGVVLHRARQRLREAIGPLVGETP
jgi:RNA polymerase sigma-70 factor (ECF subfamily)